MSDIRVVIKNVGEPPEERLIVNSLEAMQTIVGGYIEMFPFIAGCGTEVTGVCNEEGRLDGLPVNFSNHGYDIAGDAFFCRIDAEGDCASLSDQDIADVLATFAVRG